ncbi:F-box/kelch-repeat protein-like [Dorcoceras hygrometricum]|uniref:F-box/kelch-repeat protein-like n=1 Tax=Dorcoceras hygrometricum TaxID=472368 RepID=A0A2Z7AUK9_9LAMI|nr:F-box/kelch-repeat protein-like [Dorcoceras hygrometricum]
MTFRVLRTNQYNQDLGLIHSTNGNHLESPNEGSSIDHQVTIYLHAQNITMFPINETSCYYAYTRIMCYAPFFAIPCEQPAVRTYGLSLFDVELTLADRLRVIESVGSSHSLTCVVAFLFLLVFVLRVSAWVATILSHEAIPVLSWLIPCVIERLGYQGFSGGRGDDSAAGAPRVSQLCILYTYTLESS